MEALRIILLATAAAVLYGVCHDQVTVRVSLEYFTVFHPPLIRTASPTLLALGWGVVATWWVGLPLGLLLALCARSGSWQRLTAGQLVRPVAVLLLVLAGGSAAAGLSAYLYGADLFPGLAEQVAARIGAGRVDRLLAAGAAHQFAYAAGALGGVVLMSVVLARRRRAGRRPHAGGRLTG